MSDYEVLNKINSPADVKKLNAAERKELATARFPAARLLRGWTMPGSSSQILS